jgi:hypothetical protein
MAIPRIGKRDKKDLIDRQNVATDDVEQLQYVKNIFDGGNMTNVMGDPKLKDFLTSWQYSLFLNKNKFLLFRV